LRVDQAGREERGLREPVRYVHNDQTLRSAPRRVRDHLPAERAERRLAGRFQIVNLWRPFGHPAQRAPLALLDARSLAFDDLVASDLVYRDKVGETYSVKPNPEHRWYYYPHLLPEEALLLKIYDSREDAQARLGAHTAFDDPCTPADAPPRQSIELRCLLFFDE
ncbi:CmcJ/NvfI family oxidoreductase, partial [Pseudomonas aeruginosa]